MNRMVGALVFGLWLVFLSGVALAQEDVTRTLSPYFLVQGAAPGEESFPLKSTRVSATVNGVIAHVVVTQTYGNQGTQPLHARYVFPASTRAAVHGMQVQIGERRVVARIRERQQAAQEFAAAKREGKSAALLEQQRPNVFTMSVANILAGDVVEVELRYSELLVPSEGRYGFVFPTVVGPRYASPGAAQDPAADAFVRSPYLHAGTPPPASFDIEVALSTGIPLLDLGSATHPVDVDWDGPSLARVALCDPAQPSANRDFVLEYRLAGQQIQSGLLLSEDTDERFFLLVVQPPARVEPAQIPTREYVFVLDVSGSMQGFPLDTAKRLMGGLIGGLRPSDRFNVVLFAGASQLLSPTSLAATPANLQRAVAAIDAQTGGGGTELEAALRTADAIPRAEGVSRTVAVITDGFIAEERAAFERVRRGLGQTNFFAFGIGTSVNRYLIEGLARAGQGEPFVVTRAEEAAAAAEKFRRYVESPVLTQVRVGFEGFDAFAVEPEVQGDLFGERPIVVLGKWQGPRTGTIRVSGQTPSGPFEKRIEVGSVIPEPAGDALAQLWARTRIARLSDFHLQGDAQAVAEVTALGLRYSLLTRYTSFLAVLEAVRNAGGEGRDTDQPLPMPAGVSDAAVGYGSADEPELVLLSLVLLAAGGLAALRQRAALLADRSAVPCRGAALRG